MALDCSPEFLRLPLPFFLSLSEKNLQEFLYVCTVQVAPFTNTMFIDRSSFHKQFLKRVTQGTFL